MRLIAIGIVALALIPGSGSAQSARHSSTSAFAAPAPPATAVQEHKGPTIELAAVGVRLAPTTVDASVSARRARRSGIGHAGALMVVGGGAMVAGSFMNGDPRTFFVVGGAVVLLYGLYLLVQ